MNDPTGGTENAVHGEKIWRSPKWKYSIAFPSDWTRPRSSGPQIESPGVDVYSQNDDGASTAVFCYAYHPLRDMDELSEQIVNNYKKRAKVSILHKEDWEKEEKRYRDIEFQFRRGKRFVAFDTVVFCPNMQLVVSSNAPANTYEQAKPTLSEIVGSLRFDSSPGESLPIREPNSWQSMDWGYSITFPKGWNDIKHGPFPDIASADIGCDAWWGSSTFVFPYPRGKSADLDAIVNNIMNGYAARGRRFHIVDSKDYERGDNQLKTVIFEWTAPNRQENVGHYTTVMAKEKVLLVSSQAKTRHFEVDRADFDRISGSVTIDEV